MSEFDGGPSPPPKNCGTLNCAAGVGWATERAHRAKVAADRFRHGLLSFRHANSVGRRAGLHRHIHLSLNPSVRETRCAPTKVTVKLAWPVSPPRQHEVRIVAPHGPRLAA
eukprot:scaffold80590_cov65-Phaeocystis_antarctica.AAC.4